VIQPRQGLWLHQPRRRLEGRLRPHLRRRAGRPQWAARRTGRRVRARAGAQRQVLGREPEGCRL